MKSKAPSLVERTAVSIVPWPEIMMTTGGGARARMDSKAASPSMPGSQMSSITRSNRLSASFSSAASALPTASAA